MIKITFKEPQELCDFSTIPMSSCMVLHIFCNSISKLSSNLSFVSFIKNDHLLIRITPDHKDNIQSIEHVKPTDL